MEGDAILSVHAGDTRKVAELRWDGVTELIEKERNEVGVRRANHLTNSAKSQKEI